MLSYAPLVRIGGRFSLVDGSEHPEYRAYKPVDWLIDNTPLKAPLFFWAGIWGVREEFELRHEQKQFLRLENKPDDVAQIIFDMQPEEATGSTTIFHAETGAPKEAADSLRDLRR